MSNDRQGCNSRTVSQYFSCLQSVILFSKLNKIFVGHFHLIFFYNIIKIINFRDDFTDMSEMPTLFAMHAADNIGLKHLVQYRHGAAQYTGDLEFIFYGYHLDRAIPIIQRPYIV